jgi:phage gp37-like protein
MASDLAIDVWRDGPNLLLNLAGRFQSESVSQLINALEQNRRGVTIAFIETSGLEHVSPSGKKLFQERVHTLNDFCYRLVFTGKNAGEFVPSWTYCF